MRARHDRRSVLPRQPADHVGRGVRHREPAARISAATQRARRDPRPKARRVRRPARVIRVSASMSAWSRSALGLGRSSDRALSRPLTCRTAASRPGPLRRRAPRGAARRPLRAGSPSTSGSITVYQGTTSRVLGKASTAARSPPSWCRRRRAGSAPRRPARSLRDLRRVALEMRHEHHAEATISPCSRRRPVRPRGTTPADARRRLEAGPRQSEKGRRESLAHGEEPDQGLSRPARRAPVASWSSRSRPVAHRRVQSTARPARWASSQSASAEWLDRRSPIPARFSRAGARAMSSWSTTTASGTGPSRIGARRPRSRHPLVRVKHALLDALDGTWTSGTPSRHATSLAASSASPPPRPTTRATPEASPSARAMRRASPPAPPARAPPRAATPPAPRASAWSRRRSAPTPRSPRAARRDPPSSDAGGGHAARGRRPRTGIATRMAAATRPAIRSPVRRKPWRPISQPTLPGAMM